MISRKLAGYLKFYKLDLTIVMISLLFVSLALLAMGNSFKQLIDNGLKSNNSLSIDHSTLLISVLIVIFSIGSFFRSYFINKIAENIINQIKQEAYKNIIHYEIAYFEELKIGDIISRLSTDLELLSKLITNFLSFFVRNSIMLVGSIVLMFFQSPKLSVLITIIIPLSLLPLIKFSKYVRKLSKNALQAQSNIAANLEETISNIVAIKSFNQEENKIRLFNIQITDYLKFASKRLKIRSMFFAVSIAVILFSVTIVVWVGSRDIIDNNLSSGQMISFIYYAIIAGLSGGGILELLSEIHSSLVASERVFALIDYHTNENTNLSTYNSHNDKNASIIEFENVSFSYKSRQDILVLNSLSCTIGGGKFIGIVGRSGAGKSTLIQLLLKFYSPTKGVIKVAGQDITQINTQYLRNLIAYVPQDPSIFSGTIRSNIAFAKPDASEEEIIQAANVSGINEFIDSLQKGLDTEIGEKGIRLSGGQKQRIAISRAILYNPEIMLLDEATSALDSENEQKLLSNLQTSLKGKTILSIAHRISTIEQADEILVIDRGRLVAIDTHARLLQNSEIYRIICKEQQINLLKANL